MYRDKEVIVNLLVRLRFLSYKKKKELTKPLQMEKEEICTKIEAYSLSEKMDACEYIYSVHHDPCVMLILKDLRKEKLNHNIRIWTQVSHSMIDSEVDGHALIQKLSNHEKRQLFIFFKTLLKYGTYKTRKQKQRLTSFVDLLEVEMSMKETMVDTGNFVR